MMDRYKADIKPPGPEFAQEHDGLLISLPLILQNSGANFDFQKIKPAVEIMTQDPISLKHHKVEGFIINEFVQGNPDPINAAKAKYSDDKMIADEIDNVLEGVKSGADPKDLVKKFGWACPMPGSFQSSLVSILNAKSYPDAIRETIRCAGDCCSRANLIGACLGAKFGIEGIPLDWIEKVDGIESIMENAIKVLA